MARHSKNAFPFFELYHKLFREVSRNPCYTSFPFNSIDSSIGIAFSSTFDLQLNGEVVYVWLCKEGVYTYSISRVGVYVGQSVVKWIWSIAHERWDEAQCHYSNPHCSHRFKHRDPAIYTVPVTFIVKIQIFEKILFSSFN